MPLLLTFYNEPRRDGTWSVIGDDYGTELRVDATGSVYSIDPSGRLITRFVNSSEENLARFIAAHKNFNKSHTDKTADLVAVDSFHKQLEVMDPMAFSNEENWWAVVVEQMLTF